MLVKHIYYDDFASGAVKDERGELGNPRECFEEGSGTAFMIGVANGMKMMIAIAPITNPDAAFPSA